MALYNFFLQSWQTIAIIGLAFVLGILLFFTDTDLDSCHWLVPCPWLCQ